MMNCSLFFSQLHITFYFCTLSVLLSITNSIDFRDFCVGLTAVKRTWETPSFMWHELGRVLAWHSFILMKLSRKIFWWITFKTCRVSTNLVPGENWSGNSNDFAAQVNLGSTDIPDVFWRSHNGWA